MTCSKMTPTSFATVTNLLAAISPLAGMAAWAAGATGGLSAGALPARGAEVPFAERVITEDPDGFGGLEGFADGAFSVFATDLDGDGDMDVLSASTAGPDSKIAWYENSGGLLPTFTERVISTAAFGVRSIFAADVDGDGDNDVLSASEFDNKIAWYENDGGSPPTFTQRVISTTADRAWSVFATDVDGDGDTDVLAAAAGGLPDLVSKIAWYENDGGFPPTFTERVILTTADLPFSVFATDLDGDGDTDAVSAAAGSSPDYVTKVAWYESDGDLPPTFTERVISTTTNAAGSIFVTDLDDDGDIDVLAALEFDNKIVWHESDGASPPTFTERMIPTTGHELRSVFATDMDGDGDTDVLSASSRSNIVAWYDNDGGSSPTFNEHVISSTAEYAHSVFAADVDGDGDTDVLSASAGDDKIAWYENTPCGTGVVSGTAPHVLSHAGQAKNRFLSIVPGNEGRQTALRVTLTSSSTFPDDVGKQWWVGPPREICENSGQGITVARGDCGPAPGIPKKTFWRSELVCNQECHDWRSFIDVAGNPLDVLHISDPDIVTGSVYEFQAINCQCDPLDPINYSTALPVPTSQWSDTVGVLIATCPAFGPNGGPISLILDCTSIINKFSNLDCAPLKSRMDLHPSDPNLIIDISDVVACLGGFTGGGYPYPAPVGCP